MMRKAFTAVVALTSLVGQGCSDGGLPRHDLSGNVTFKGDPVPSGTISFRPDRKKGGSGPSGFAKIIDGEYGTSGSGRGAVAGPVQVMIEGAVSKEPMAAALFPNYKTSIDVSGEIDEFDFEVPEPAPRSKKKGASRKR